MNSIQPDPLTENAIVADKLREVADLLEQQAATQFRVRAYRDAASYIATLPHPVRTIYEKGGQPELVALPTIGVSIAAAIAEFLDTGVMSVLDRLRGSLDPESLFQTIPMIGPTLAHAVHETLHIDTLEGLEAAAIDGRLATINGIGPRRVTSIRHSLGDMLARRRLTQLYQNMPLPRVADILSVDREYRERANTLPTITPRRFNETRHRRIPVLHTERGPWQFTALFSNSARAHQFGRTRDWVVIYFERGTRGDDQSVDAPEGQATVITQHGGGLDGRRVVRSREAESAQFYDL